MIRVVSLDSIPENASLASQWNELVFQMKQPEVFYTYEWALAVARAFSDSIRPLLMLAYDEASLIGIAPLAVDPGTATKAFFLGARTSDYCDLISKPEDRFRLVEAVLRELKQSGKSECVLSNLPEASLTCESLNLLARKFGYKLFSQPAYVCSQVAFSNSAERAALKEALSRKKAIHRNFKLLAKTGRVDFRHCKEWDEIRDSLGSFTGAHVARFLAKGRISPLVSSKRRQFLVAASELLSAKGWLTLSKLNLNGQGISWNLGFQFAGKWFWYMPTFDIEHEKHGPGLILLKSVLEQAADLPCLHIVDLGLGDEPYKERFANARQRTCQLILTNSRTRYSQIALRALAIRTLRRSATAERVALTIYDLLRDMRNRLSEEGLSGLVARFFRRAARILWARDKVLFFDWACAIRQSHNDEGALEYKLESLNWSALAMGAMRYEGDKDTEAYIIRAAERLREKENQGFALTNKDGIPMHFCWAANFQDFFMSELQIALEQPESDSILLFDCWTPKSARGQGLYPRALRMVATHFSNLGKRPWIFSASTNRPSLRGIEKAGFEMSYCAISQTLLAWKTVTKHVHSA